MKRTLTLAAAALLVVSLPVCAQTAGSMGTDAAGTGSTTLGTDADPTELHDNMKPMSSGAHDGGDGLSEGRAAAPDASGD